MAGWQLPAIQFDLFQKKISPSIFNILLFIFVIFNTCTSLFQFFVFSFAKLSIKFSIIMIMLRSKAADINKDPPMSGGKQRNYYLS